MAVENRYVNQNIIDGKKAVPAYINGDEQRVAVATFEVAAADDDGSIYRIFRVNSKMIPVSITVTNDAITGGTDYDIGIYNALNGPLSGAVKDADALADGLDLSSARAEGSGISGLSAVAVDAAQNQLFLLAGDSENDQPGEYDIAITANTVGTAAGTVTVKATFVQS